MNLDTFYSDSGAPCPAVGCGMTLYHYLREDDGDMRGPAIVALCACCRKQHFVGRLSADSASEVSMFHRQQAVARPSQIDTA